MMMVNVPKSEPNWRIGRPRVDDPGGLNRLSYLSAAGKKALLGSDSELYRNILLFKDKAQLKKMCL